MNNKGNIVIVILAAIGMVILLMLGVYAQRQLIHDGPVNPGRHTQPSENMGPIVPDVGDTDETEPDETEDDTSTETTGETEGAGSETGHPTQPTEPDATVPRETTPHTPTDAPPAFTGAGGERDDESPLDPD